MESINLNPGYSTKDVPGKCIKCLAERELGDCLRELLRGETDDEESLRRFETLATFLRSPESKRLRDESEKLLAEGKQVTLKIHVEDGDVKYELEEN